MQLKLIYGVGEPILGEPTERYGYRWVERAENDLINLFLEMCPQAKKTDVLELFEYMLMSMVFDDVCEADEIFWFPLSKESPLNRECQLEELLNMPNPNFESEYISVLGELFFAGYVDFIAEEEVGEKEFQDVYLSEYGDKYEAWKYFRDWFIYRGAFLKGFDDDIIIYDGKEYTSETCPTRKNKLLGYSTMYSPVSWDTPRYWSQYNIWVARTEKGAKYFNEILAPKFYNKYKDLEVEIDSEGNIIRWIGEINR